MSTAISGLNTTLYCGDSATALTKLCDIKDVPDLISEPNLLDATTLSDPMQVNIFGIIQSDTKSFTANYNKTDYKKVKEAGYDETSESNAVKYYALKMQDGSGFTWQGDHQLHFHQEARVQRDPDCQWRLNRKNRINQTGQN